jgi:hypothetical protein
MPLGTSDMTVRRPAQIGCQVLTAMVVGLPRVVSEQHARILGRRRRVVPFGRPRHAAWKFLYIPIWQYGQVQVARLVGAEGAQSTICSSTAPPHPAQWKGSVMGRPSAGILRRSIRRSDFPPMRCHP